MKTTKEAIAFFEGDLFAATALGARIVSAAPGESICEMVLGKQHKNANGGVMGGVLLSLADFAFAVAANEPNDPVVTLSLDAHFLTIPHGDTLTARAKCIHNGHSTCVSNVSISDAEGRQVCLVNVTGFRTGR